MGTSSSLSDLAEFSTEPICYQVGGGGIQNGFAYITYDASTDTTITTIVDATLNVVPGAVPVACPLTLSTQVVNRFIIWAEESGGLQNNSRQWSFGNGAVGNVGLPMWETVELVGLIYHAETAGTGTKNVRVEVDNVNVGDITIAPNTNRGTTTFVNPVTVNAGELITFQTITAGGAVDVRIGVVVQVTQDLEGLEGPPGADGLGVPPGGTTGQVLTKVSNADNDTAWQTPVVGSSFIQVARIRTNTSGDINNGGASNIVWGAVTLDTIGVSVSSNLITLPEGTYHLVFRPSLTSGNDRTNLEWELFIGGVSYQEYSGSNYIRDASGHNQAGDTIDDILQIPVGGSTINITSTQEAGGGTVVMNNARSILLLSKYV